MQVYGAGGSSSSSSGIESRTYTYPFSQHYRPGRVVVHEDENDVNDNDDENVGVGSVSQGFVGDEVNKNLFYSIK